MSDYYWYEGKKIPLQSSTAHRAVRVSGTPSPDDRRSMAATLGARSAQSTGLDLGNGIILFDANPQAPRAAAGALPSGSTQLSVFAAPDTTTMILTEEFNVQFKPEVTRDQIDQVNVKNKVKIVSESQWERNAFVLAVQKNAGADALVMANRYHDGGLTTYAQPNFIRLMKPAFIPNDPLFPQQWALRNTGQGGGIAGQDIHAVDAWDISRGAAGITIAIIDEGVDYAHPDLNTPGKLVTGYDAVNRVNDPTPSNNDAHGTACAGIAGAASGNGTGVSGVAPNCSLMGVRIAYGIMQNGQRVWVTSDAQIADGINTAVARGADVLSNSWGGGSPSTAITNAIRNAKTAGRGGRGCVVCFAAGNANSAVSYPGILPEVITVAACNEWGERKSPTSRDGETQWGSNFGPEVDVCAPGVHITTTDIHGASGYSAGDYTTTFNGTSAATPHVAGVAALVLSLNPNLTAAEVETILRASTDDLGAPGYDVQTGFGRINALKAVQSTDSVSPSVARNDIALVRQTPGWASIPVAFSNGDGTWNITNGGAPQFISDWAHQPGVRVVTGDFNGNGLTDIALVRQTPGWASIPVAFSNGDGTWNITNGGAPVFIPDWAHEPGVRVVTGDFHG